MLPLAFTFLLIKYSICELIEPELSIPLALVAIEEPDDELVVKFEQKLLELDDKLLS